MLTTHASGVNIQIRALDSYRIVYMFSYKISADMELRLLEERHAEQVFALIVEDRDRHPELDKNLSLDEVRKKINHDLALFADNKGLNVGVWYQGILAGTVR